MLGRERALLWEQIRLEKGGKVELPPGTALVLKPVPWGKDGKGKRWSTPRAISAWSPMPARTLST